MNIKLLKIKKACIKAALSEMFVCKPGHLICLHLSVGRVATSTFAKAQVLRIYSEVLSAFPETEYFCFDSNLVFIFLWLC